MSAADGLTTLAEFALRGASDSERIIIYDALALMAPQPLADGEGKQIADIARTAAKMARHLRGFDEAQRHFDKLLQGGTGQ